MTKKKKILLAFCAVLLLLLNLAILYRRSPVSGTYELQLGIKSEMEQAIQVYYSPNQKFSEQQSQTQKYEDEGMVKDLFFSIPSSCSWIRLDLGVQPGEIELSNLTLSYKEQKNDFEQSNNVETLQKNQISSVEETGKRLIIRTNGTDPYLVLKMPAESLYESLLRESNRNDWMLNLAVLLFLDGGAALAILFRRKVFTLPIELIQNRTLILSLAKNDFKTKYAGSYLGIVWAFIQPIVTILVYWFVFSVGFKSGSVMNYPFVLYLVSGIVPWFFFQDALNGGTNSLLEYNYLVKKVVFKISILPIVKIMSALFVHVFFVAFALALCAAYGYMPSIYTVQLIYYSACTFLFSLGLVYATSAIVIFFRDLTQIINIFLQVGVWLTPVMWDLNMLSNYPLVMKLFKLNPMYYIVSGYRDSMLGRIWFWETHWGWTLYFWVITVALFAVGSLVFKRLKPHFADVL